MAATILETAPDHASAPALQARALAILLTVLAVSWAVSVWLPLGCSILAVFLFAGPHNWLEARYMLGRLPARWGPLASYFAVGLGGTLLLTASYVVLPWATIRGVDPTRGWLTLLALWNTGLIVWLALLAEMRSRQNPRRAWPWLWPAAFALVGLNWLWPLALGLLLVYGHPLVALWVLDRELKRMKSPWRGAYQVSLCALPAALAALWLALAGRPDLPGDDGLSLQIAQHAGGGIAPRVSTHLLVATHVFLELLHYGVWIVAIPLVSVRQWPWEVSAVPLARRSPGWRWLAAVLVATGAVLMLVLWAGFAVDYPLTRTIYFTVAIWHVLAEAPFLLRLL